jgi:hypothetical protein
MEPSEAHELLTAESLALLESLGPSDSTADAVALVARLRAAGHPPARVAAVLTQYRLRRKAATKFGPFAQRMLFTEHGLEQASRLAVAAQHAGRFARAGFHHVADLGCGIGGDAMALAALDLSVVAVERDEPTAALATFNLAPWPNARVELGDAEKFDENRVDALWMDPARREGARRLTSPDDWSPSLDAALSLTRRRPGGIKLGPGMDRGLIPDDVEAQWVSDGGDVVEVVLWTTGIARPGVRRAALVLGPHGTAEMTASDDSRDAESGALGEFLYEPDGAVIRARLIGDLARTLGGRMLDPSIAWITTDTPTPTPFARAFRVRERWPLDVKSIGRSLRERDIGTLEIKKRGVDVDPAVFRRQLKLSGSASATLVLTRVAGKRVALLVDRAD